MTTANTTYLLRLLRDTGLLGDPQIETILDAVRQEEQSITEAVVQLAGIREEDFLEKLGETLNLPFVQLGSREIEPEVLAKLPTKAVFQYRVVPLEIENGALLVASNDPLNADLIDALRLATGMRVKLSLSTSEDIARAAKAFYGVGAETVDRMIQDDRYEVEIDADLSKADLSNLDQEASVVKFVNQIIWEAVILFLAAASFFSSSFKSKGTMSRSSTFTPAPARRAAMPPPMIPDPMTAAFLIFLTMISSYITCMHYITYE